MSPDKETNAFQDDFDLLVSVPSADPLPLFAGMERWQVWRKR